MRKSTYKNGINTVFFSILTMQLNASLKDLVRFYALTTEKIESLYLEETSASTAIINKA